MTGLILIIVISLMSMLIAYLADMLGKRLGKKRISVFGLRPRYTAIFVTVIGGALISLITFGILISLSAPIRIMLLKTEEIQERLSILMEERNDLKSEFDQLQKEVTIQSDVLQNQRQEIENLTEERDSYENDVELLSSEIIGKQTSLDELQASMNEIQETIDSLEEELKESENNLTSTNQQLSSVNEQLSSVKDQLNETIEDKNFIEKEITYLEDERDDKIAQIGNLNKTINSLIENRKALEKQINRMQTEDPIFLQDQRLYGFQIPNELLLPEIRDLIFQSFRDFDAGIAPTGCRIEEPSPEKLVSVLDKISSSNAEESIVLVFAEKTCYAGDLIPVEFLVFNQYIVYEQDTIIEQRRVDDKINTLEARYLIDEMISNATSKAYDKGLLRDTHGDVFKLSFETLDSMAERIARHRRPMIVRFITKTRIERADYLDESNIELDIIEAD